MVVGKETYCVDCGQPMRSCVLPAHCGCARWNKFSEETEKMLLRKEIERGNKVRHRASGEVGIVTQVLTRCVNPEHDRGPFTICSFLDFHGKLTTPCKLEVVGYAVSTGFGSNHNYDKILVELVEEDKSET